MLSAPPRRRRARPVADAPIDELLALAEDLAKGWLLALLEQAPLDEAPAILAADLSREGPRVCQAVLRAVASDGDLRPLEPGGALVSLVERVGELAGAGGPEATSRAVDALHAVIWTALRDALRAPDPSLVSELTERLTHVTDLLRAAALRRGEEAGGAMPGRLEAGSVSAPAPAPPAPAPPAPAPPAATPARPAPTPAPPAPTPAPPAPAPFSADPSAPSTGALPGWPREPPRPSQALWVGALEEEIQRSEGAPLSLLLAELEDADRIAVGAPGAEASSTFGQFAHAVRGVVRRQDLLVCETEARAWIIARDTTRPGAQALGWRIAQAVREGSPWRGAPMAASVGVAVLGEDGDGPEELMDAAEEARFAAAASGVRVLPGDYEPEG